MEILSGGSSESKLRPLKDTKAGKVGGKDGKTPAGGGAVGAAGGAADDDKGKAVAPEVLPVESPPVVRSFLLIISLMFSYIETRFSNLIIQYSFVTPIGNNYSFFGEIGMANGSEYYKAHEPLLWRRVSNHFFQHSYYCLH